MNQKLTMKKILMMENLWEMLPKKRNQRRNFPCHFQVSKLGWRKRRPNCSLVDPLHASLAYTQSAYSGTQQSRAEMEKEKTKRANEKIGKIQPPAVSFSANSTLRSLPRSFAYYFNTSSLGHRATLNHRRLFNTCPTLAITSKTKLWIK